MTRMSARHLFTFVPHWQIILLTLSVHVIGPSRRINGRDSLPGRRLRSQGLVTMRNGATDDLLHGRIGGVVHQIRRNVGRMWEGGARIDAQHLRLPSDDRCLVLSMRRLSQVVLERSAAQIGRVLLVLVRILLGETQVAALGVIHLLHVEVGLSLISVIVEVLVDLLLSGGVVVADAQFLPLVAAAAILLVLKLWVDTDLVAENRLVFPVLDTDFLILASKINSHLD